MAFKHHHGLGFVSLANTPGSKFWMGGLVLTALVAVVPPVTTTQTITGVAAIQNETTRTITAKGRIGILIEDVERTQTSRARLRSASDPDTYPWRNITRVLDSTGFANRVLVLGAHNDTEGTELRATANDTASQAELGRIIEATVVARDIETQAGVDLAATIELALRGVKQKITFDCDVDGLKIGQLVKLKSTAARIDGFYVVQGISKRQVGPLHTIYTVTAGDCIPGLRDLQRQLERIKTGPTKVPPVPPPSNSVGEGHLKDGSVTRFKVAERAINDTRIALASLKTELYELGSVTEVVIGDDAISAPKLQANSVIAGKVAADAIVGNNIQAGSVTALDAIFATGTILRADIADAAIDDAKIDSLSAGKINTGTLTVGGAVNIAGTATVGGSFFINGNLSVGDDLFLDGTLEVGEDLIVEGTLTVGTDLNVEGTLTVGTDLLVEGSLTIGEDLTLEGTLIVGGDLAVEGEISADLITSGEMNVGSGGLIVTTDSLSTVINGNDFATGFIFAADVVVTPGFVNSWNGFKVTTTTVINSSGVFTGNGVNVGSNPITGGTVTCTGVSIGGNTVLAGRQANPGSASTSHAVADFTNTNGALDALGTVINAIVGAMQAHGLVS